MLTQQSAAMSSTKKLPSSMENKILDAQKD